MGFYPLVFNKSQLFLGDSLELLKKSSPLKQLGQMEPNLA
jgi:hypothetical protein